MASELPSGLSKDFVDFRPMPRRQTRSATKLRPTPAIACEVLHDEPAMTAEDRDAAVDVKKNSVTWRQTHHSQGSHYCQSEGMASNFLARKSALECPSACRYRRGTILGQAARNLMSGRRLLAARTNSSNSEQSQ